MEGKGRDESGKKGKEREEWKGKEREGTEKEGRGREGRGRDCPLSEILNTPLMRDGQY